MAEVILALDLPTGSEALNLLDRIPGARWVKVGSILMTAEGAPLVQALVARRHRVFLDLKWHDIPNTVAGAVMAARKLGVAMATVHTVGGRGMMEAAAAAAGGEIALVGVTVLTSHDAASYGDATGRPGIDLGAESVRQATLAVAAGLAGVVCSPREVASVRSVIPEGGLVVVPGIRRENDLPGDQVRVASPREAVRAGATHLVVGRPVLGASDPAAAFQSLSQEAGCVSS